MISAEAFLASRSADVADRDASVAERSAHLGGVSPSEGAPCPGAADAEGELEACREAALRLLDAAPRPSGALRERLAGKGYAEDTVEDVIGRLTRVGLIDDHAYAASAVRYCLGRMMGRRGAVTELARKGVDRATAEEAVAEADGEGLFTQAAWELGRRTARRTEGMDLRVRQRRFWAAGGRKGHDPQTLRTVAAEVFKD